MHSRFAAKPKIGMSVCFSALYMGCLWNPTMQMTQLRAYNMNVPKLEVNVISKRVLGRAAIPSCVVYPKLERKPCGSALISESLGAGPSPNARDTQITPTIAEITTSVQMERCGVRLSACSAP